MSSCERRVIEECGEAPKPQDPRDWENNDLLSQNYNLSLEELKGRLLKKGACGDVSLDDIVYVYVVASTRVNYCWCSSSHVITQWGCAPNFEGGIITLTNCMHYMRCLNKLKKYFNQGKLWIAGVTTKNEDRNPLKKYFLFYLMKVDNSLGIIDSFCDIWNVFGQVPNIRSIKNACQNPLGDFYQPKPNCNFNVGNSRWDPNCYYPPRRDHPHYPSYITQCNHRYKKNPNCWTNCNRNKNKEGCWAEDIAYYCNNQNNRPLLLVGENPFMGKKKGKKCFNSYLWSVPKIEFTCNIQRGHRTMSLRDFLSRLRPYP